MPVSSTEALEKNAGSKCWADGNFINHSSFTQGIRIPLGVFSTMIVLSLTNMPLTVKAITLVFLLFNFFVATRF